MTDKCVYVDMPKSVPLRRYNKNCKRTEKRKQLGLWARFEAPDITLKFVKALLKSSPKEQRLTMRRFTDRAVAVLGVVHHMYSFSPKEKERLRFLVLKYKDPNTRVLKGFRAVYSANQGGVSLGEWGDQHLKQDPKSYKIVLRRILGKKSLNELIKSLHRPVTKEFFSALILALYDKLKIREAPMRSRQCSRKSRKKRKVLFALLRKFRSSDSSIREKAMGAFMKIGVSNSVYHSFLRPLVRMALNKRLKLEVRAIAIRALGKIAEGEFINGMESCGLLLNSEKARFVKAMRALSRVKNVDPKLKAKIEETLEAMRDLKNDPKGSFKNLDPCGD